MIRYHPQRDGGIQGICIKLFKDVFGHISEEFWRITATGEELLESALVTLAPREAVAYVQKLFYGH